MIACDECKYCEIIGQNKFCLNHSAYIGWHGCESGERKSLTHADELRTMTDEELAEFVAYKTSCETCAVRKSGSDECHITTCGKAWLDWLRQEAEEERHES